MQVLEHLQQAALLVVGHNAEHGHVRAVLGYVLGQLQRRLGGAIDHDGGEGCVGALGGGGLGNSVSETLGGAERGGGGAQHQGLRLCIVCEYMR